MSFWINYLDREPFLARMWMSVAAYQRLGHDFEQE